MTDNRARLGVLSGSIGILLLVFMILPSIIVIPMSFSSSSYLEFPPSGFSLQWYTQFFTDSSWTSAALFSLKVGLLSMICATVIGTMAALALVRASFPGKSLLETILLVPLIVPHVVVAIAVYAQFAPLGLTGTYTGFVLIHSALAVPYVILVVTASLQRIPPSLEMAALNLGASRVEAFFHVTLPMIRPALVAGAVFAFLASFDETVVSFFISGVEHKTITRKLFEDIEYSLSPVIAAASSVFVLSTILLTWWATRAKNKNAS